MTDLGLRIPPSPAPRSWLSWAYLQRTLAQVAKAEMADLMTVLLPPIHLRTVGAEPQSLGITDGGLPKHPLYLAKDTEPGPYRGRP